MRVLICGQGEREKQLSALCLRRGHTLPETGPWEQAVLPLPRSSISEEWADQLPRGQKVVCGLTDARFDQLARRRGWRLMRVLEDEEYVRYNAALTAEGALCAAMNRLPRALKGADCLVIGYGRIGKCLSRLLRALDARVTVAARRQESRREAGAGSVSMEELPRALPKMDVIFNTVPAPVLGGEELKKVKKSCLLLELASAPYGIDLAAAEGLGLNAFLESGLPGRYCPQSAAETLLRFMEREETT